MQCIYWQKLDDCAHGAIPYWAHAKSDKARHVHCIAYGRKHVSAASVVVFNRVAALRNKILRCCESYA